MSDADRRFQRSACYLAIAMVLGSGTSAVAEGVGKAVLVRNDVKGALPGIEAKQMAVGQDVNLGLALKTGKSSALRMTFDPQGSLLLGASAQLTIDQPTVDKATGRSTSKLELGVGWLRVAVDKNFNHSVEISTPSAVVGIKGTVVDTIVDPSGKLTVICREHTSEVQSKADGASVSCLEGNYVGVPLGGSPSKPRPIDAEVESLFAQSVAATGGFDPASQQPDAGTANDAFGGPSGNLEIQTETPAGGGRVFSAPEVTTPPPPPPPPPSLPPPPSPPPPPPLPGPPP